MSAIVLVSGTGTDVGKTHVTASLLAHAPVRASAWKPFSSGALPGQGDPFAYAAALGRTVEPPLVSFEEPISPHLAARRAGVPLDEHGMVERARALAGEVEVLLVEGAGGLFSPLSERSTWATAAKEFDVAGVLLVAPDRLGVLHDVTATLKAAETMGVPRTWVVLSAPEKPDASTGENAAELARLRIATPVATFPRAPVRSTETGHVAAIVWTHIVRKLMMGPESGR